LPFIIIRSIAEIPVPAPPGRAASLFVYFNADIGAHLSANLAAFALRFRIVEPDGPVALRVKFTFEDNNKSLRTMLHAYPAALALVRFDFDVCHDAVPSASVCPKFSRPPVRRVQKRIINIARNFNNIP
jgi:hypothetical protein